ncbi:MAG: hypothetical protein AMJ79_02985 [Phycisphaerae bacterium SM23_30]|nr:MAG: hypothetical protein AMJ79_02985 [Phycisphaerae bacterium SM23_30]
MMDKIPEKNKQPGVFYAYTDHGVELAVIDVTNPAFAVKLSEADWRRLSRKSRRQAKLLKLLPGFLKRLSAQYSHILGGFFLKDSGDKYLDGMSTLMSKLGPENIGGGKERDLDRVVAHSLFSAAIRTRLRDISTLEAQTLTPLLQQSTATTLRFINIAGGSGVDSFNALNVMQKNSPGLLQGKKIEINILDTDRFGPNFGRRCVEALQAKGGPLQGLDIEFKHVEHNWSHKDGLKLFLQQSINNKDIMIGVSEGGLFEYGSDEEIISNLKVLRQNTPADFSMLGDVLHDIATIDPAVPAMMQAAQMHFRYLGRAGIEKLARQAGWQVDHTVKDNPLYAVFRLKKIGSI